MANDKRLTVTEIEPAGADDTIGSGSSTVLIG